MDSIKCNYILFFLIVDTYNLANFDRMGRIVNHLTLCTQNETIKLKINIKSINEEVTDDLIISYSNLEKSKINKIFKLKYNQLDLYIKDYERSRILVC